MISSDEDLYHLLDDYVDNVQPYLRLTPSLVDAVLGPLQQVHQRLPHSADLESINLTNVWHAETMPVLGPPVGDVQIAEIASPTEVVYRARQHTLTFALTELPYSGAATTFGCGPQALDDKTHRYLMYQAAYFLTCHPRDSPAMLSPNHWQSVPGNATADVALILAQTLWERTQDVVITNRPLRMTIIGTDAVGRRLMAVASKRGYRLVAAANQAGGVASAGGLAAPQLLTVLGRGGDLTDNTSNTDSLTLDEVLSQPTDILFLAEGGGLLDSVAAVDLNAKLVVEAAHGAITPDGAVALDDLGIAVLPDLLVADADLIAALYAHQNWHHLPRPKPQCLARYVRRDMFKAYRTATTVAHRRGVDLRTAALIHAIETLGHAYQTWPSSYHPHTF